MGAEQGARVRRTLIVTAATAAVAGLLSAAAPVAEAATSSVTVLGAVECPSGQKVVGVWIESSGGGSKFADWVAYPGATTVARYGKTISATLPTTIFINVGCGGSASSWGSSNRSPSVKVSSAQTLYLNVSCSGGSCTGYPKENNTPAAPSSNPGADSTQCTWRAADFWKTMVGRFPNWGGNAHLWDDNASATGWAVRSWPRPDSIVVWQKNMGGASSAGHVGYAADVRVSSGKLQMKIYDRNWGPSDRSGVWVDFVSGMKFLVAPARVGPRL